MDGKLTKAVYCWETLLRRGLAAKKSISQAGFRICSEMAMILLSLLIQAQRKCKNDRVRNEKTLGLFPSALKKVREFSYSSSSVKADGSMSIIGSSDMVT